MKICPLEQLTLEAIQDSIRHEMYEISKLLRNGEISWYYFLLHQKPDDTVNGYFDVVFTTDKKDPQEFLPKYCHDTKKIPPMNAILGINVAILERQDIAEAWRIIGEQSEFIVNVIRAHSENSVIPHFQVTQFMHFFMNPLGLGLKSILFIPEIPPAIREQIDRLIQAGELLGMANF